MRDFDYYLGFVFCGATGFLTSLHGLPFLQEEWFTIKIFIVISTGISLCCIFLSEKGQGSMFFALMAKIILVFSAVAILGFLGTHIIAYTDGLKYLQ